MSPHLPRIQNLDAVFFDFDGVILESTKIKDEAFEELFSGLPEHLPGIIGYHHENLGLSRYEKFDWIYRELLKRPLDAAESSALGDRFSELVLSQMHECAFVPGAESLLQALQDRARCFVVSGTPTPELEEIVTRRSLGAYFVETCGSPPGKKVTFSRLLEEHQLIPDRVLAVGDGRSDYEAAAATGVHFVARLTPGSRQEWPQREIGMVRTLDELGSAIGLPPQTAPNHA